MQGMEDQHTPSRALLLIRTAAHLCGGPLIRRPFNRWPHASAGRTSPGRVGQGLRIWRRAPKPAGCRRLLCRIARLENGEQRFDVLPANPAEEGAICERLRSWLE